MCCWAETTPTPSSESGTGIEGLITLHNIQGGPYREGVADSRPLSKNTFVVKKGDETIASFATDDKGRFQISLPPGHYSISKKDWESHVGHYVPFEVEVAAGQVKKVECKCYTGMQ